MCCCTNQGEGHRCPAAWKVIHAAQQARMQQRYDLINSLRQRYTTHLRTAGVLSAAGTSWPDHCQITMADDPRCPACLKPIMSVERL